MQGELLKSILLDHCYALNMKFKTDNEFKCGCCGKVFAMKSRLKRHRSENCGTKPNKQESCRICGKFYTHNGLRDHLRNYTAENRTFRGKHKKFSTKYHFDLLKQLKKK